MEFKMKKRDIKYAQALVMFVAGTIAAWMFIGINAIGVALLYGCSVYLFLKGPVLVQPKADPKTTKNPFKKKKSDFEDFLD